MILPRLVLATTLLTTGLVAQTAPIRVSSGVMAGQILTKVPPAYTEEERQAAGSGVQVLHAIIGSDGHIKELTPISGSEALRASTMAAVRQWTYRPYLVDGVPVEVDTTITLSTQFGGPSTPPAVVAVPIPKPTGPMRISGGVMAGSLMTKVTPAYPKAARDAHVSGTVVMHAVIGKDGRVANLTVLSGPEMLQPAALEAVEQWTYRPFLLNGEPTEVDTTITVNFNFGSPTPPPAVDPAPSQATQTLEIPSTGPVRLSTNVMAARVLHTVPPEYPPMAKAQHITGSVVLKTIIGADGKVSSTTAMSGPEVLRTAAVDCVRQWTYKPYLLNGKPTEVETAVVVYFNN